MHSKLLLLARWVQQQRCIPVQPRTAMFLSPGAAEELFLDHSPFEAVCHGGTEKLVLVSDFTT